MLKTCLIIYVFGKNRMSSSKQGDTSILFSNIITGTFALVAQSAMIRPMNQRQMWTGEAVGHPVIAY